MYLRCACISRSIVTVCVSICKLSLSFLASESHLPGYLAMIQDLQTTVISACTKHKEQKSQNADYRACVYIGTDYFVKYGARRDLEPELATQGFIFNQTKTSDAPRIAQIVHHFVDQRTMYLVMGRIKLQESPPSLAARIQKAMKWLSEVPLPSNYALGPVGRGRIRHKFFKDFKAPFVFPDVVTLDQYVKTVRPCFDFLEYLPPANMYSGPGVPLKQQSGISLPSNLHQQSLSNLEVGFQLIVKARVPRHITMKMTPKMINQDIRASYRLGVCRRGERGKKKTYRSVSIVL